MQVCKNANRGQEFFDVVVQISKWTHQMRNARRKFRSRVKLARPNIPVAEYAHARAVSTPHCAHSKCENRKTNKTAVAQKFGAVFTFRILNVWPHSKLFAALSAETSEKRRKQKSPCEAFARALFMRFSAVFKDGAESRT